MPVIKNANLKPQCLLYLSLGTYRRLPAVDVAKDTEVDIEGLASTALRQEGATFRAGLKVSAHISTLP